MSTVKILELIYAQSKDCIHILFARNTGTSLLQIKNTFGMFICLQGCPAGQAYKRICIAFSSEASLSGCWVGRILSNTYRLVYTTIRRAIEHQYSNKDWATRWSTFLHETLMK